MQSIDPIVFQPAAEYDRRDWGTGPKKKRRREWVKLRIDEAGPRAWVGEGKPGTLGRESRDRCRKRCGEEEGGQPVVETGEGW